MTPVESAQVTDVVQRVQNWPSRLRLALARRILDTLDSPSVDRSAPQRPRGPTAAEMAALFKTDKPAPNDDEVRSILEEELMRKYDS